MQWLEKLCVKVPFTGRIYYSGRWLVRLLKLWRSRSRVTLAYPPGHYASPLPDPNDISGVFPKLMNVGPDLPGIELNVFGQLHFVSQLSSFIGQASFPVQHSEGFRYYYENPFFTYADAITLHAILRHVKPLRLIEIGSGFSSAVMLDTRDRDPCLNTQLTFIEPNPERLLSRFTEEDHKRCNVIRSRVQWVEAQTFKELEANDILFIDSSHVSKIGSDVNYLIFQILPQLNKGVYVHIHDIFWPFEYPKAWHDLGWAWNEAYILRAFLQHNSSFEVVLFLSQLESQYPKELESVSPLMLKRAASTPETGGSSLWLRKVK